VGADVSLAEDVVVEPNVVFVQQGPLEAPVLTQVGVGVQVGANAVIYPGVKLAAGAVIRPGSVVTRAVPPGAIVEGNPAVIVGYVNAERGAAPSPRSSGREVGDPVIATNVRGVTVHSLPVIADLRGDLSVGDFERQIPFLPRRYFIVFNVPNREVRGEHAHRQCHEFLVCVRGSCAVIADDGTQRTEVVLDAPNIGVLLPAMTWRTQYKHSPDALLLVFASEYYDANDYVRDYGEFLSLVSTG
jgi:dTDP-4-dehydrorhamnose 3,5-epimerase-like enzyme